MTTQEKVQQELVQMAIEDREKTLRFGVIMLGLSGLFLMTFAIIKLMLAEPNQDTTPFDIVFVFGILVTLFGIFAEDKIS